MLEAKSAAKTKEQFMWKVLTGKRKFLDRGDFEYEYEYLQRDDGFTIKRLGIGREKQEEYSCTGDFGEFRFYAIRWDPKKDEYTNKYIIHTKMYTKGWPIDEGKNEQLIKKHARDIESGFLHFPATRYFDYKEVKEVWFDISSSNQPVQLVRAWEL